MCECECFIYHIRRTNDRNYGTIENIANQLNAYIIAHRQRMCTNVFLLSEPREKKKLNSTHSTRVSRRTAQEYHEIRAFHGRPWLELTARNTQLNVIEPNSIRSPVILFMSLLWRTECYMCGVCRDVLQAAKPLPIDALFKYSMRTKCT